ncbi:Filamentation induced by cAMP protein Fic (fragment) (plasmid) [Cupriavidus taiwanensis]|uniref:Filamentation induced by cAMP protein Fic n=1 Tax=Cupriavidus taiwanensis TaxID=164546 RepID=A0A375ITY8_9BURK
MLRDVFVWACERSTQEYVGIKQDLAEPDPLRVAWRDVIKQAIRDVVLHPDQDALAVIRQVVIAKVPAADRDNVQALIIEELRRLHQGVLARNGLRPSELAAWKAPQLAAPSN